MADAELLERPADLGELGLRDLAAGLGGEEIVAAAIAVGLHEQAVALDHLDQPAKAAQRAFLVDQKRRVELAGGVIHRNDQVERRLAFEPGVLRAVLVQHHAPHRPAGALAPMGATPRRRRYGTGLLQVDPSGRVAELVVVALRQLLVEMLDRETWIVLLVQRAHALELVLGRAPGRGLPDPPVDQAVRALLLVALPPATQGPLAHAERRRRLAMAQMTSLPTLQQLLETHDPDPRKLLHPAHPRSKSLWNGSRTGQITRYLSRPTHALSTSSKSIG
ncbi:MAG: hypothetical protein K0R41_2626 [Geminicoccaceae bacterium]|nr:hypothetical protein [Geminicoccaceae bacterium]